MSYILAVFAFPSLCSSADYYLLSELAIRLLIVSGMILANFCSLCRKGSIERYSFLPAASAQLRRMMDSKVKSVLAVVYAGCLF